MYAIKDSSGTLITGCLGVDPAHAWRSYATPRGTTAERLRELGYTCVPVTVSEGEAEKLLRDTAFMMEQIASIGHLNYRLLLSEKAKQIDAYLKGKP